jgi:precorrin-6A/cobalt-precorrin-6A reductase
LRLLLLGGTSEASELARRLAGRDDIEATLSLAGRTSRPAASPLPTRVGGFGAIEGLTRYLVDSRIDALIDATHPFAAQMSAHAVAAAEAAGVPLAVLTRPAWTPEPGDDWREVGSVEAAADALGEAPRRVFLTVGRLHVGAFRAAPQHHYVLRSIDAPEATPPDVEVVLARPPFTLDDELELMRSRRIDILVSKNSGGEATRAKLDAARRLKLPVVMVRRPPLAARTVLHGVEDALGWLHGAASTLRGVST